MRFSYILSALALLFRRFGWLRFTLRFEVAEGTIAGEILVFFSNQRRQLELQFPGGLLVKAGVEGERVIFFQMGVIFACSRDTEAENLLGVCEFGAKVEAFPIFTAIGKRLEEEIGSYDDSHNTDINIMPGMLLIKYN